MPGLGVIVNVIAIAIGTAIGLIFGGIIPQRVRDTAFRAIGLVTFIIGAGMAIGGLADMGETKMGDYAPLVLVGALVLGGITGELIGIEKWLERFGHWLQEVAGRMPFLAPQRSDQPGEKGHTLVEGFVTASLLFCVGAMTVLGSIQDGLASRRRST